MKKLKILLLSGIIFCVLCFIFGYIFLRGYLNSKILEDKYILIEKGNSINYVINKLEKESIIKHKLIFKLILIYKTKNHINIKYGEYFFEKNSTVSQIIYKLISNKIFYRTITFAEGLSTHSILKMIRNNQYLTGEIPDNVPEGSLLPETYTFQRGDTRESLIKRMQVAMFKVIEDSWEKRADNLPFKTKVDALILASIVEKETGIAYERPLVASVFVNRLKINMPLQSDPTAIYGYTLGDSDKEKDIKTSILIRRDSPYNTYKIKALPPAPICNPGKDAIEAVLNPANTKYLFFVATGNGGHNFSENYFEHRKMVKNFRDLKNGGLK